MKTSWKAFTISMPTELIPLYDFLQAELNYFLTNYKDTLENIDLKLHKGNIWRALRDIFRERVSTWNIKNKTWYSYIVFENLRRELESKKNNVEIFNLLKENNFQIDSILRERLMVKKLFPTNSQLRNLARSGVAPTIPDEATFQLDYTVSSKQMFSMDKNGLCKIQLENGSWFNYQLLLPSSIDVNFTGKIAKPRFMKRKRDGAYIGLCSYEIQTNTSLGSNVLGVDLGFIKPYCAVAITQNGSYSNEFLCGKRVQALQEKMERLKSEKEILFNKLRAYEQLKLETSKTERLRFHYIKVTNKLTRVKEHQAKLIANEILHLSLEQGCKEVHLENLSWLESKAGKWHFSNVQGKIEEKCRAYNIKVVYVSAYKTSSVNPITQEVGVIKNRTIYFEKSSIDRDFLAAINIALRKTNFKIKKLKSRSSKRVKVSSIRREIKERVESLKGSNEIVLFLPNVGSTFSVLTVWPQNVVTSQKTSLLQSYNKLQF